MMLRRRGSEVFYREVRLVAEADRPVLDAERKERLKHRIMISLGEQAQSRAPGRSRVAYQWVRVPAGVGIAAAVVAAASPLARVAQLLQGDSTSVGVVATVSGKTTSVEEGRLLVPGEASSLLLRDGAGRVDLNARAAVRVSYMAGTASVELARGRMTVASGPGELTVRSNGWRSAVAGYSIVDFEQGDGFARLSVIEGRVILVAGNAVCDAGPGEAIMVGPGPVCIVVPAAAPTFAVGGSETTKAPKSSAPASSIEFEAASPPPGPSAGQTEQPGFQPPVSVPSTTTQSGVGPVIPGEIRPGDAGPSAEEPARSDSPSENSGQGNGPGENSGSPPGENSGQGNGPGGNSGSSPSENSGQGNGLDENSGSPPGENSGQGIGPGGNSGSSPGENSGQGNGPGENAGSPPGENSGQGNGPGENSSSPPGENSGQGNGPGENSGSPPAQDSGHGHGPGENSGSPPAQDSGHGHGPGENSARVPGENSSQGNGPGGNPASSPGGNSGQGNGPGSNPASSPGGNRGQGKPR